MTEIAVPLPRIRWSAAGGAEAGERMTAQETPVALVHDGSTTAVMMATPGDLEDFGVGFSLSEGIVDTLGEIRDLEIAGAELGIEVRMWLSAAVSERLAGRRRRLAGATGCGLCGIESLAEAARPPRRIANLPFTVGAAELLEAMEALGGAQRLGDATRAVHAAGLWLADGGLTVREDVGRHNALDKLIGARARAADGRIGVLLLTSRVSVEMVQKAAVLGAPVLCAVSAPTALAVRIAEEAGVTLVAVARRDGLEIFTHPERVSLG